MATYSPANTEAETRQQGDTNALPQQSGTPMPQQHSQQQEQQLPLFRDFASI